MGDQTKTPAVQEPDLAEAIRRISEGMNRLLKSGLNRRAVVALLKDDTGVAKGTIEAVLTGLSNLAMVYTTK